MKTEPMSPAYIDQQITLACVIGYLAHLGQTRSDGVTPYFSHCIAVAASVSGWLKAVALLHDVVEDTELSIGELRDLGVDPQIVAAVDAITKRKKTGETYEEYLLRVSENPAATAVKIADIEHNMSCQPTEKSRAKYVKALPLLKAKLAA